MKKTILLILVSCVLLLLLGAANNFSSYRLSKWSKAVRARDNNTCVICGSQEKLEAHHILPKALYPDSAYMMINGITLCDDCHLSVHRKNNGWKVLAPAFFAYTLSMEEDK